jgi:hypothetical protein
MQPARLLLPTDLAVLMRASDVCLFAGLRELRQALIRVGQAAAVPEGRKFFRALRIQHH